MLIILGAFSFFGAEFSVLRISWLSEADDLLALCLKAAAAVKAAPKQFRYSRQAGHRYTVPWGHGAMGP